VPVAPKLYLCEYRDVEEKLLPSVGLSLNKRGGVNATGSGYRSDSRKGKKRKPYEGIPWLKIMIALEVIILLVLLFHGIAGVITKSGMSKEKSEYMVSSYAGID
jgi:hypothetical protein